MIPIDQTERATDFENSTVIPSSVSYRPIADLDYRPILGYYNIFIRIEVFIGLTEVELLIESFYGQEKFTTKNTTNTFHIFSFFYLFH